MYNSGSNIVQLYVRIIKYVIRSYKNTVFNYDYNKKTDHPLSNTI